MLCNVPNGTFCKHTGLMKKGRKLVRSKSVKDNNTYFTKVCDAFQLTKDNKEVIFHPHDMVIEYEETAH